MSDPVERALATITEAVAVLRGLGLLETVQTPPAPDNRKKLTKREVRDIRELYRAGHTKTELGHAYGVHRVTISRTLSGVYHKGVK